MVRGGRIIYRIAVTVILVISGFTDTIGQVDYNSLYFYRFYLKDKGGNEMVQPEASEFLSRKSIDRRIDNNIVIDFYDMPVYGPYIDTIINRGLNRACVSKWLNTVTASSVTPIDIAKFLEIPFIDSIKMTKSPVTSKGGEYYNKQTEPEADNTDPPPYWWQLELNQANRLHEMGFKGSGIVIAVIDGGFAAADMVESLSETFNNGRILGTYDFVNRSEYVYDYSQHGTAVLSILAGNWSGMITGSAPMASYWLLRSEETIFEYLVEEDFWVAAAEFADSVGADIISTSLGYSLFTDPGMNHTYRQMDGKSIFISRGAEIAFSRGIVVVTSAGNSRDDEWYYITAPADAENALAVGAVDPGSNISDFSSSGPTSDNRVKPDVATMGVAVTLQKTPLSVTTGNGTSYACPLLSGMIACLMQSVPEASHSEITGAVRISADRYMKPDYLYGYGIANIFNAYQLLIEEQRSNQTVIHLYPNPVNSELYLRINKETDKIRVSIFDTRGQKVLDKWYNWPGDRIISIPEIASFAGGIYFVKIETNSSSWTEKIIKLKE